MIKETTFKKLYEDALQKAEKSNNIHSDEQSEVILIPIVISTKDNKIMSISGVNSKIILENEN